MPQVPFSQAGIDQKLAALYSLTDASLETEADNVKNDFRNWLTATFDFNQTQLSYLNEMEQTWLTEAGANAALAIRYRLPVVLHPPQQEPPQSSKYVRTTNNIEVTYNSDAGTTASGSVTFSIDYL